MANVWNALAIIAAILGFLALLGAWFIGAANQPTNVPSSLAGGLTRNNLYYSAIALFVLAIVIWVGSAANAASAFFGPQL
jgi:ABC-type multidrug transport system permease subunit